MKEVKDAVLGLAHISGNCIGWLEYIQIMYEKVFILIKNTMTHWPLRNNSDQMQGFQ